MISESRIFQHLHNLGELLSISAASASIKSLEIEENNGLFPIRPQLHVIIRAGSGELKSSALNMVKEVYPESKSIQTMSTAGLVGSIDSREHRFVAGLAWLARDNIMVLDEFTFTRKSDWIPWLQLLENQEYSKKTGQYVTEEEQRDGDLYFSVKNGYMNMKTRFVAIIATMRRFEHQRGEDFKALLTRCVPYDYKLTLEEIDYLLDGNCIIDVEKYRPEEEIVIPTSEYLAIKEFVRNKLAVTTASTRAIFARAVNDCIRIHAVQGNADEELLKNVISWKLEAIQKVGADFRKSYIEKAREEFRLLA